MPYGTIQGTATYYSVQGEGPPVIFIHPPVLSSMSFSRQASGLAKDARTVLFDIRGHGRSSFSREAVTYPRIAEDVARLMDHLGIDRAYLCGYSIGGSIVLEFLLNHPERAIGAILVGGMSEISDAAIQRKIGRAIAFSNAWAISLLALSVSWSNSDTPGLFWATFREARLSHFENVKQYYQFSLKYNCTEQLDRIGHPVLLVYGEKDYGFHRYGRLLQANLKQCELEFIPGVKHQIPTKAADELNQRIRAFIAVHGDRAGAT